MIALKEECAMDMIDTSKYNVEIKPQDDDTHDELLRHLLKILNDRSIPEENKRDIRKQYDEIMRIKMVIMKPPSIILTPKK
jgi:hypothetical protein